MLKGHLCACDHKSMSQGFCSGLVSVCRSSRSNDPSVDMVVDNTATGLMSELRLCIVHGGCALHPLVDYLQPPQVF